MPKILTDIGTFKVGRDGFTSPDDADILEELRKYVGEGEEPNLTGAKIMADTIGWMMVELYGTVKIHVMQHAVNSTINAIFNHLE